MARVGGICSILGGALFLASGAAFFLYQVGPFDWSSVVSIGYAIIAVTNNNL
jgi:hypothetical protein